MSRYYEIQAALHPGHRGYTQKRESVKNQLSLCALQDGLEPTTP